MSQEFDLQSFHSLEEDDVLILDPIGLGNSGGEFLVHEKYQGLNLGSVITGYFYPFETGNQYKSTSYYGEIMEEDWYKIKEVVHKVGA